MKKLTLYSLILINSIVISCDQKKYEQNVSTPGFIIDAHIHYWSDTTQNAWKTVSLEVYKKYNIMGCFFVPMNNLENGIKFANAHPNRVIPYAEVDLNSVTVLEDIQKAYDMGYKGLGELFASEQWNYNDPRYDAVWSLAEKLGMPVCLHTGVNFGANGRPDGHWSTMRPCYIGTIASKFPNLKIHAAHFGEPWYEEAGEVAFRCKNVYFDFTGISLIKNKDNPEIWKRYLWWTPFLKNDISKWHFPADAVPAFGKIVFGTDLELSRIEECISNYNKMFDACNIPDSIRKMVYYGNMAKMHNIDVSKYLPKK